MTPPVGVPLFAFEDVSLELDGTPVLRGVTVEFPASGITVVIGPSGSGKSTVLRLCNRLAVPTTGVVRFRGTDLATLTGGSVRAHRRRVGMVFQKPTLFAGTVRDNFRVAMPEGSDDHFRDLLARVGLDPTLLDRSADALSGGQAQRATLARTLATAPEALLMDEPTSALDVASRHELEHLAVALAGDGVPVVWVTHDLEQADRIADRLVVVVAGRVATPEEADAFRTEGRFHEGRHHLGDEWGAGS